MRQAITAMAALLLAACGGESGSGNEAAEAEAGGGAAASEGEAASESGAVVAASFAPGLWESTTEVRAVQVSNMPQGFTPPLPPTTTVRTCLTPEQASRPPADFMSGGGDSGGCSYQDFSMANGRISGTIQCDSDGASMSMTMNGSFTPASYDMTQRVETSGQGMTMEMQSRTTGRRVGDCPG